jgi:hypothetical protein
MSQYLLMLYNVPKVWADLSPEEMQKATQKYMAWRARPTTLDGKRLADDLGRVIRSNGGKPHSTDGPYSETKEVLGGVFLVEAANYDEAVKLAMTNPHLDYGGTIEVREIFKM